MLRVEVYPVMGGIEVRLAAVCLDEDPSHKGHRGSSVYTYVDPQDLVKRGLAGALAYELTVMFHEYSELTDRATC